jgi:hypothetical protein
VFSLHFLPAFLFDSEFTPSDCLTCISSTGAKLMRIDKEHEIHQAEFSPKNAYNQIKGTFDGSKIEVFALFGSLCSPLEVLFLALIVAQLIFGCSWQLSSQFAGISSRRLIRTGPCSRWRPSLFSHLFRFTSKASPPKDVPAGRRKLCYALYSRRSCFCFL